MVLFIAGISLAQAYDLPFYPQYWVGGKAVSAQATAPVNPDGRTVVFYKTGAEFSAGKYATEEIGPNGLAGSSGEYLLNVYGLAIESLDIGSSYYVFVPNDNPSDPDNGVGANPVNVTISGNGYDEAPVLMLAMGKGRTDEVVEKEPRIKLWFGNRLYQPAIVAKGQKFVVSPKPEIRVEVGIDTPYTLAKDITDYSMVLDAGTAASKPLALSAQNVEGKTYASGTMPDEQKISGMSLRYTMLDAMPEGEHTFSVTARSSGLLASPSSLTEIATVEVLGGPLRVIGIPITFPSPYSITKDKLVTIQYELSAQGNITIFLTSPTGEILKRWNYDAGSEGGSAGVNKITWDGRSDRGYLAGNAIYLGSIISRDDNRLLGKFKLTIVD